MSSREVSVQWVDPPFRCVLYSVDGVLELRLEQDSRTTRLATCRDLDAAETTANQWRIQLTRDRVKDIV